MTDFCEGSRSNCKSDENALKLAEIKKNKKKNADFLSFIFLPFLVIINRFKQIGK